MNFFEAIVLGIIQGLTEFLPVSSSGHIVIGSELLGLSGEENLSFAIVVHAATVMSTVVILWSEIWKLLQGVFKFRWNEETQYVAKILLSMIPVLFVGLFLKDYVKQLFENMLVVGVCLLCTAALLVFASKAKPKEKGELGWLDTFIIGIAQSIAAIFPGLSRSGATISTGILLGNNKEKIAKFSFLMVLIPILGEALLDMKGFLSAGSDAVLSPIVLFSGFLAAFITGCIACKWMIELVKKGNLVWFAVYCAIIGIFSFLLGLNVF